MTTVTMPPLPTTAAPTVWLVDNTAGTTLDADPTGNNQLSANAGNVTLVGSAAGNNTYIVYDTSDVIDQVASAAPNTVETWGSGYSIASDLNVQNVTLEGTNTATATGNAGDNILTGNAGIDTITTGGGNDTVIDGTGADTIIPTREAGSVTWVENFKTSGTAHDTLDLYGLGFQSFAQFESALTQDGVNTVISLAGGQSVVLADTQAGSLTAGDVKVEADPASGMHLIFDEEFDGALTFGNGTLNTGSYTWNTTYNDNTRTLVGNHEQEIYVDPNYAGNGSTALGLDPFSTKNGVMAITASQTPSQDLAALGGAQYVSGVMTTENSFSMTYGYVEMSAEMPTGDGLWPAFWMLPENGTWPPELDIMEQIGNASTYVSNGDISTLPGESTAHGTYVNTDTETSFNTYGMSWTPQDLTFYFDGEEIYQMATPADMDVPMYLILDLAVGGTMPGDISSTSSWANSSYLIDWVRAYSTNPNAVAAPTAMLSNESTASFAAPGTGAGTSMTYSAAQLNIAGVTGTTVTVSYDANNDLTVTNNGAWNSIKEAAIDTGSNGIVTVNNFVTADVTLGNGDSSITVTGAKRGTISVGQGNDVISVQALSNATTENVVTIEAGDGDNRISFSGASNTATAITAGNGNNTITIGGQATATIAAGSGNNDLVDQSTGAVSFGAGSGSNTLEFLAGAHATVTGFSAANDTIVLHGLTASQVTVTASGGSTTIAAGSGTTIHLAGVTLGASALPIAYA
jgi:beta-glucanase (GH16 family)